MKVTYESLPKKFEEIKQHLTPGTIDAVNATLPIWEFYGDAEFKPSIDDVIELVNNELPDDEPAPAPKPATKAEEKPKKEPKAKAPKEPKWKYDIGDWVWAKVHNSDGTVQKVKVQIQNQNSTDDKLYYGVVIGSEYGRIDEKEIISKAKAPKEPKPKKEPEGEPVAKISPEVAIIKRFVNCCKSKTAGTAKGYETARKILAALQKHIEKKEIRKTSQYAKEIMDIQKALLTIVYKKQKADFDKAEFESLEKIAASEYQEAITKLSISFIGLIGKVGVKDNAKSLLEKFEKAEVSGDLVDTMKKALKAYIDGKTTTVETEERALQGIYGLAGI